MTVPKALLTFVHFFTTKKMFDFICTENIKSLIEYIVTQYLSAKKSAQGDDISFLSAEDSANPYVETFNQLRKAFDKNIKSEEQGEGSSFLDNNLNTSGKNNGLLRRHSMLNKIAIEDQVTINIFAPSSLMIYSSYILFYSHFRISPQRKFRQADEDDSYFNDDDDVMDVSQLQEVTSTSDKLTSHVKDAKNL